MPILGTLIISWAILLSVWCLAFIVATLKVMVNSYTTDHIIAYIRQNPNNYWVTLMIVSFLVVISLLTMGFIGLALVP